jgi:anti-sigma B factor antagonist
VTVSSQQLDNDIWLISLQGRLDQSLNPQLEQSLGELLDEGHERFIIDLTKATYINSGGLRCLVTGWRRSREQGGDLVIFGLNNRLQEIFSLVGFDRVFQIYISFEDAQRHIFP